MFIWELSVVVLLILLNGFFALSELAVISARRVRLQQMAEAGSRGARAALRLHDDPSSFLSTVQIGISLVGILAGAYGGATLAEPLARSIASVPALARYADLVSIAAVVAGITYLSLVIGELVPKRIALANAERIAVRVARPMALLAKAGAPLVWILGASVELVVKLLGLAQQKRAGVTEEEIRSLIAEGTRSGVFQPAERDLLEGVLRLADRPVRAIMTPRPDVVWLDAEDSPGEIQRTLRDSGHSRLPVSRGELDEILGIVQTKDLLGRALEGQPLRLSDSLQRPLIVHDGTPSLRLLELFRQSGVHMGIVVDEYGSVEGIVTATDVLEKIAGALPERGQEEEPSLVRREDGSWLADGMLPIDELEDRLGLRGLRGEEDFHTLAGFVLSQLQRLPKPGEAFAWNGARFEVVDMDGRRVDKVVISLPAGEPPPQ